MMFRRLLSFLVFSLSVACTTSQTADSDTLYVTILPLRSLVQEMVGDDFKVEVLVPPGASPETFDPNPRQVVNLNRSRLIFSVGLLDFEHALMSKVEDPNRVVNLSQGIEIMAGTCSHHHHGENHACDHAHGVDPHIWIAPRSLKQMIRNAGDALMRCYPDSSKYAEACARMEERLQKLDDRVAQRLAESDRRLFVIYHPALTYYARDYGLTQLAVETDGKEPSARHLAELIRVAQEYGVRKILYQSQFPASAVEVIADDLGADPVQIDPLHERIEWQIEEITRLITE